MNRRILFVDDEPALLDTYRRLLCRTFRVTTAEGPERGLVELQAGEPFAVVVSDMRMPGMSGIEFLSRARKLSPDTVRVMLTGYTDVDTAVDAVNEGNIFRFLQKPCHEAVLSKTLEAGISQYSLITAEKELLEKTLAGAVQVLTEVLSLVNPSAFGRATRIRGYMRHLAGAMGASPLWAFEIAGLLSQVGCITLSAETLSRASTGQELDADEGRIYAGHPKMAMELLQKIPRLGPVAEMIGLQLADPSPGPARDAREEFVRRGGAMLRVAVAVDRLVSLGTPVSAALEQLARSPDRYPREMVDAMRDVEVSGAKVSVRAVAVKKLEAGMILDEDVRASSGVLLVAKGHEVTMPVLLRLRSFADGVGVQEPIRVLVAEGAQTRLAA